MKLPPEPVDPEVQGLLDLVTAAGRPDFADLTPAQARRAFDRTAQLLGGEAPDVAAVDEVAVPGAAGPLRAWIYRPLGTEPGAPLPALMWMHGGGFVFGSLESYDTVCRALANASRCALVAIDYRLAPEHPFPAAVDDCLAAWQWLNREAGALALDRARLGVGGDSAGGNLAAVLSLLTRDAAAGPPPRYQALVYPGTTTTMDSGSHREFASGYLLTRRTIDWAYLHYRGGGFVADDNRLAPLLVRDLAGLPPCSVLVAGYDPLRDEGIAYAERLAAAGVAVKVLEFPSMIHGFLNFRGKLAVAGAAIDRLGQAIRTGLLATP